MEKKKHPKHEIKIRFNPLGREVYVLPGTTLLEAAERAGIGIENPCNGRGTCGKCRVQILEGNDRGPRPQIIPEPDYAQGYRLACQVEVEGEMLVRIPTESMLGAAEQILTTRTNGSLKPETGIEALQFKLEPPSRESSAADAERLGSALDCRIPYRLLKDLPGFLRANEWQGTAIIRNGELVSLARHDQAPQVYGAAFDIGTTTIAASLFNLASGEETGVAAEANPQLQYGADVLSRIERVRSDPGLLREMQRRTIDCVNSMLAQLCGEHDIGAGTIYRIAFAGNSTMQQILLGIDPSPLGELPFAPAFTRLQTTSARELGIDANPSAQILVMPQIGGFVGGDTVSAMLSSRLADVERPKLLIDIGTNGEIVLADSSGTLACSAAAGPALEGAKISRGMRAASGAIEKVVLSPDGLVLNVIGNAEPRGICGSGLIDSVAEMLRSGVMDASGRIRDPDELPEDAPAYLAEHIVSIADEKAFLIVAEGESCNGDAIAISQRDISETQLAIGAIRAGIRTLLARRGLVPADLDEVLLAGAFGNYIRKENAMRIGLIPEIEPEKIRFIGNAALHGAELCLLMQALGQEADRLAANSEHIDLSMNPDFQTEFAAAMVFPA